MLLRVVDAVADHASALLRVQRARQAATRHRPSDRQRARRSVLSGIHKGTCFHRVRLRAAFIMRIAVLLSSRELTCLRGPHSLTRPAPALVQTLLDFQLAGHEKFLAKFRAIFRRFDTDQNGVLDEEQFRNVVACVDPTKVRVAARVRACWQAADDCKQTEKQFAELLTKVDPFTNQHITFSEVHARARARAQVREAGKANGLPQCVSALSAEIVNMSSRGE